MASIGKYASICGGSLYAGVLLERMMYLYDHSKVVVDGVRWYVRSKENLMEDTGLSRRHYDRAVDRLKELGYVEFRYLPSLVKGEHAHLRTTAFRVLEKAKAAMIEGAKKPKNVPTDESHGVPAGQYIGGLTSSTHTVPTYKKYIIKPLIDVHNTDVSVGTPKGAGVQEIERAFREGTKSFDPDYFHVSWTIKTKGIAKQLATKLGGDALEVVRCCTENWTEFRDAAKQSSTTPIPVKPSLFSIVFHASAALSFTKLQTSSKSVLKPQKTAKDFLGF
jgi:hypothetical protein